MAKKGWSGAVLALTLATAEQLGAQPLRDEILAALLAGKPHVPGELLVEFRPALPEQAKGKALGRLSAKPVTALAHAAERSDGKGDLLRVRLAQGERVDAATLARFRAAPEVAYAEPNWIYSQQVVNPNDPALKLLWGLQAASTSPAHPYGSGALAAWNAGMQCSKRVHVGVIDEGVMFRHVDLKPNIWINPGEGARADGRDNDLNGKTDDIRGWDFNGGNASIYDGPQDDHGTHVAGTLAAVANNATGIFGLCPSARLITAKFIGSRGGTTANAVRAIRYLTALKRSKKIALVALNASWGGGGYSQALYDAIQAAGAANILFVTAAGNSGDDLDRYPSYPASYALDNLIAVAALAPTGGRASFSSYGERSVHLAAPGVQILSTVPSPTSGSAYAYMSGTSMAAPHVTGAAALYASLNPCASALQIKEALLRLASRDPLLLGRVAEGRRLNIEAIGPELGCPAP